MQAFFSISLKNYGKQYNIVINTEEASFMPKKILVVDDEKPISDIIKFNLTKEGFDVDTAYDGEEAVKKLMSTILI